MKPRRILNMKKIQKGVWVITENKVSECPNVPEQDENYFKATISDRTFDIPNKEKTENVTNESIKASATGQPKRKLQPRRLDFNIDDITFCAD